MIFTRNNWLPINTIFKISGNSYQVVQKIYNNNQQEWKFIIQSLFDNGNKYPYWESELKEKLLLHRRENKEIFGLL